MLSSSRGLLIRGCRLRWCRALLACAPSRWNHGMRWMRSVRGGGAFSFGASVACVVGHLFHLVVAGSPGLQSHLAGGGVVHRLGGGHTVWSVPADPGVVRWRRCRSPRCGAHGEVILSRWARDARCGWVDRPGWVAADGSRTLRKVFWVC
jgi:hypothetical protein